MPGGDRTGPMGMGPMTGRARGYCRGAWAPAYGAGFRRGGAAVGFGRGRGWRRMAYATGQPGWARGGWGFGYPAPYRQPDPETEKQALQSEAQALQAELAAIERRLTEIQNAPPTE
jgi:hypothetical protein